MTKFLQYIVFSLFVWLFKPSGVFPWSGPGGRSRRDIYCREDLEFQSGNICCLNCPAGTRMVSPCTKAHQKGQCVECDDGTFTEHSNSLRHCFRCTQCRSDQEIARPCTHTHNSECRCKSGGFCDPEEACEVCKKCSRCENDEEVMRNCTSTTNTECKKVHPKSVSASANAYVIVPVTLLATGVIIGIALVVWRRHRSTDSPRNAPERQKVGQHDNENCPTEEGRNPEPKLSVSSLFHPRQLVRTRPSSHVEDERKVLCESLNSSASNSQHSLTIPASPPQARSMIPWQPDRREDEQFPKLVPVNGDESLKKCFEYFEDIDFDYHKRFFRHLGISDNVIKGKESVLYEDKIHALLNVWVEKVGSEASLNDLLKALVDLNQRRTAENIKQNAILSGHYCYED